ncbi:sulfite exporter TauE/SafE family protein [uncultured Shimia sp.]|uniref:sulfite exporter TauE/SafE family protein n=1 Tax=uncultured Shimia sp. TaxID=573152 RepID=UPI002613A6EE|nr:sulfite exporter TauE/SafE family protein [uncultured Shimia sp.]
MIAEVVSLQNLVLVGMAFALGGILKGAVGAGAPLLAVPLLALLYDVPTSIALFAVPNIVPNLWQIWQYRDDNLPKAFRWRFFLAGTIGTVVGTFALASVKSDNLMILLALIIFAYVIFKMARPGLKLDYSVAERIAAPVGLTAGFLQTLAGISAPVSLTFLNVMHLERRTFIATISGFFVAVGVLQIPLLAAFGIMTWPLFLLGCAAVVVIFAFMPVGAFLGRRLSADTFNKVILVVLTLLAIRLLAPFVVSAFA